MDQQENQTGDKTENKNRLTRLAERTLPRRVRFLLEGLQERTAYFEAALGQLFEEVEKRLFKQADSARNNVQQARLMEAIRELKRCKADIVPRFLVHLESSLALVDETSEKNESTQRRDRSPMKLELVDSRDLEISLATQDIGNKAEIRHSTALYLLGHRLGVIAGRSAFEPEDLPLGPHALARALQYALSEIDLDQEDRISVFHDFDSIVIAQIGPYYDTLNRYLAEQGVLPTLQVHQHQSSSHKPVAERKADASPTKDTPAKEEPEQVEPANQGGAPAANVGGLAAGSYGGAQAAPGRAGNGALPGSTPPRMPSPAQPGARSSGYQGSGAISNQAPAGSRSSSHSGVGTGGGSSDGKGSVGEGGGDSQLFTSLRGLLAERRRSLGTPLASTPPGGAASRDDLQDALGALQSVPNQGMQQDGKTVPRNIGHIKQDLLNELKAKSPDGKAPVLAEEDSDTIDLIGMLFDYIGANLGSHRGSRDLIAKLQVPVLRSAISDKHFFTQRNHPARQLLNNVAEASAKWMSDEETDSGMVDTMNSMVDRVTNEFNGDIGLMESLLDDFGRYMSQVTRRAEITERRHIDAAKGRERLDLSREQANTAIARLLKRGKPAPMVRAVLEQAWTDVLALTLLRQGEDSQAYRRCLAVADQLMQIGSGADIARVDDKIREEVRNGLQQVGLHNDEIDGVLGKLFDPASLEKKTSHTEITHALKSKTRLGGDALSAKQVADEKASAPKAKALTAAEKEMVQRIRTFPFGTWFDFVTNQQGSTVRRKLAWFSTVTGRCLFVNQRGARSDERSIEQLARDLVSGQVRLHKDETESFVDRAWNAIKDKLKHFSGQSPLPASA
ncbi:MAG TPA: DUF1631 family protein [Dokdonella sp.]|uniref:DUF1631 domain-containing protein n=1 Tax=Dokdonella sp. TaxID=2291710 RepID=UPI002D7F1606|nr:DUF1631 family protein [Dokdonella sp.]HET9034291.1 DUF1631 family protein [Dokdonella sp.]